MIRIRKHIDERSKSSSVGIALAVSIALVMALAMILGTVTAFAVDPRPCPDAADPPASDAIGTIVTKYAAAMGNDTTPADLSTWNPQPLPGDSGGVLWDYFPSDQASGTGVFDTYLAVMAPGIDPLHERGYNTALKPAKCSDYDEDDAKTRALPLSAVPKVDIGGTIYREFVCDINEVSGIPEEYVSLEVLQIWQTNSTNLCGTYTMSPDYKFTPGPRLVYDLDCEKNYTLILDYGVNTGSGKPDYKVFIPNAWFDQTLTYIVMVVDHGNIEVQYPTAYAGYGASDGFEEWGVRVIEPDVTPPTVVDVFPDSGAIGVAVDEVMTATLSEAIDSSTVTSGSFRLEGGTVSGTVTYDSATRTATFTPDANLQYNREYTAVLSTAITDLAGNPLAGDCSWSFTTEPEEPPTQCTAAATGTGEVCITTSHGFIEDLKAVPPHSLPSVLFPHGMFDFRITGLTLGQIVTLTIEFPSPLPIGTLWWKYDNGRWHGLPNENDNGDHIMVITLTDGGIGDLDNIPGQITDPGGPGNPMTVGWETSATNKAAVLAPWVALFGVIAIGASLFVLKRRI